MRVLAIDTALQACSVALLNGADVLVRAVERMDRGQAERLAPLVQSCFVQANLRPDEIDRIAVTRGPGAFTGIRIGLAFARSFALALGKPCFGFSTLEVLAMGCQQPRTIAAIEAAGSLYLAAYDGCKEILAPFRAEDVSALEDLAGDWKVTGPAAAKILAQHPLFAHVPQDVVDPVVLARMAQTADVAAHPPAPLYLRGVQAKLAEAAFGQTPP